MIAQNCSHCGVPIPPTSDAHCSACHNELSTPTALAEPESETVNVALVEDDGWASLPGRAVAGLGGACLFLGAALAITGVKASEKASVEWVVAFLGGGALFGSIGAFLFNLGKRMAARSADQAEAADGRPPVLLLRRFQDDDIGFGERTSTLPTLPYLPEERLTFEELVAEAASVAGPVVAIGDPKEGLPKLGAARAYVANDAWQARVNEYLGRAGLVVMLLSRIEGEHGLAWELRAVLAAVPLERVVFVLPPVHEEEARRRWTDFHERSGGRLPAYQGGELAAGFDPDGTCHVARAEGERTELGVDYAAVVGRFARAASARPAAQPTIEAETELVLEPVPPAQTRTGHLSRRFPLGSWKTVLVFAVASQLSCASAQLVGRFGAGAGAWSVFVALVLAILALLAAGGTALAFTAALERRAKGLQQTNTLFLLSSFVMVVCWLVAAGLAGWLVYAVATGKPRLPGLSEGPSVEYEQRIEGNPRIENVPTQLPDVDKLFGPIDSMTLPKGKRPE